MQSDYSSAQRYGSGCRTLPNLLLVVGAAGVLHLSGSGAQNVGAKWVYNETPAPSQCCQVASHLKSDKQITGLGSPAVLPAD